MVESASSSSDQRITSLITTSITDMVRQEVAKIMEELSMPVDNEAIDRIITENLDKQVEKQSYMKTYKRKFDEFSQYKCVETSTDPDDIVLTNLQLIENRVKRLEDFVLQNLKESPELMHDLADRKRENSNEQNDVEYQTNENNITTLMEQHKMPALLNFDDVIRVIKECPETQDSFEIFQSAAERIKYDLERFIKEFQSNFNNRERPRNQGRIESIAINSKSDERRSKSVNNTKETENQLTAELYGIRTEPEDYMVSTETVKVVSTSLACGENGICFNYPNEPDSDDVPEIIHNEQTADSAMVKSIVLNTIEITTEDAEPECKITEIEADALDTKISKAGGDKPKVNHPKDSKLPRIRLKETSTKNSSGNDSEKDQQKKTCKECRQRLKRDQTKTHTIDEDIKWKLDKILDHIGDFCSRSKSLNKESASEPESMQQLARHLSSKPPIQPGTSAESTRLRRTARSSSVRSRHTQPEEFNYKTTTSKDKEYERKNIDRLMDQIRLDVNRQRTFPPKTEVEPKMKAKKSVEIRPSVEEFRRKWSQEYTSCANKVVKVAKLADAAPTKKISNKRPCIQLPPPPPVAQQAQKSSTTLMLESIDQYARRTAVVNARMARENQGNNEFSWVYSRRPAPPEVNLNENRCTKVLYHNYKM